MRTIYIKHPAIGKFFRARVTQAWAVRHDNFALVSCGLTVGDDLTLRAFARIADKTEVTHDEWNHSGCQSACKLRGASECRW